MFLLNKSYPDWKMYNFLTSFIQNIPFSDNGAVEYTISREYADMRILNRFIRFCALIMRNTNK